MITLICQECKKSYITKPYMIKKSIRHFCSFKCYGAWQSINRKGQGKKRQIVKCCYCGKDFEKMPSAISKNNFCNQSCFNKWQKVTGFLGGSDNPSWKGGHVDYRGRNWSIQRGKALKRDKYSCKICGNINGLLVHHKKSYYSFDDYKKANALGNLITLCNHCHSKLENVVNNDQYPLFGRIAPHYKPEMKKCEKCQNSFVPTTIRVKWCNSCRSCQCNNCGSLFFNKRCYHRQVKYCSKECFNKHLKKIAKWPHKCQVCDKAIHSGRYFCRKCFMIHIKPASNNFLTTKERVLTSRSSLNLK